MPRQLYNKLQCANINYLIRAVVALCKPNYACVNAQLGLVLTNDLKLTRFYVVTLMYLMIYFHAQCPMSVECLLQSF